MVVSTKGSRCLGTQVLVSGVVVGSSREEVYRLTLKTHRRGGVKTQNE